MRREPSEQTSRYCDQLKSMRTNGNLRDAYRLGRQLHGQYPDDEYIEGAFSWVVYDCLKRYKDEKSKYYKDLPAFIQTLRAIPGLKLDPQSNDLFFENVAKFIVSGVGWDLRAAKNAPALQRLLECLAELDANEGSRVYKTMLAYLVDPVVALGWDYRKASDIDGLIGLLRIIVSLGNAAVYFKNEGVLLMFAKGFEPTKTPSDTPAAQAKKAEGVVTLIEWFGLENFTPEMFVEAEYQGKMQQSLAEKLVSRYADVLGLRNREGDSVFDENRIRAGLNSMESVLQRPEAERWIWPQYKYGKLLMTVEGSRKARPFFAKVLLDKWNESYIWGAFADTFLEDDATAYEKCLFRGLRLARNTGFSLALHEKAMLHLKSMGRYREAKREALIVSDYRRGQGWQESNVVEAQKGEEWFESEPSNNNEELYLELSKGSEEYVFPYAEKACFYVEWKDEGKNLMGIVSEAMEESQGRSASRPWRAEHTYAPSWAQGLRRTVVKNPELMQHFGVGACYAGVLSKDGRTILGGIARCTSEEFTERLMIDYEGTFDPVRYKSKQGDDKTIGFVRDTQRGSLFVPPNLFRGSDLEAFDIVKGTARAVFKDERWTMEVTSIEFLRKPNVEDVEKEISGTFEGTNQSFGFVDGCFIPGSLVFAEKLNDYDFVTVLARKSWDKKKGKWSWTAKKIIKKDGHYD